MLELHSHSSVLTKLILINLAICRLDTTPSILNYPIIPVSSDEETHDTKRTKLSEAVEQSTIASSVDSRLYTSIEGAAADIETAVSSVIKELQQKASVNDDQRSYAQTRELRAEIARAAAFKKRFDSLLMREMIQRPQLLHKIKYQKGEVSDNVSTTVSANKSAVLVNGNVTSGRTVLTLYGSAPQPKQLFSSLQQAAEKDSRPSTLQATARILSPSSVSNVVSSPHNESIREHALPNGISFTKVIPVHSKNDGKTKVSTLGELFAPPPSLPPLNPPKQLRYNATRSSSVAWLGAPEPSAGSKPNRRDTFSVQPQSTCTWLRYNSSTQLSSPEAKRKERERALSVNEPPSAIAHDDILAQNQAKEEALFRSVYSSFAPDRDNTGALITDYTKNRMWWKREGEKRYQDQLETEYPLIPGEDVDQNGDTAEQVDSIEEDEFKGIADDWTPKELPPELKEASDIVHLEIPEDSKEVDEILQDISDLLETLNSYQRNRNLSLANSARTSSQLESTSGSPTTPSSSEVQVFTLLQSQLALMVATLPPYALAKLDGEKLGVLNVKTMVRIQDKQYKGTMEEDESFVKPKQAPMTPAVGYPPRNINPASSVPARSSAYVHPTSTPSQPIQRPNYATQPRPGVSPAAPYLPNQQYSSRPTSTNPHFPGTAYSTPRTGPMASERYSYAASQQYSQRIPQTPQTQPNGYRSYSAMNGPSYSPHFPIAQQGASAASFQGQRPTQPGYQQRAMNSQAYVAGSTPSVSAASPSKPGAPFTPQQAPAISMANQQRPPIYHQHSGQYGSQTPLPRQVNGSSAAPSTSQTPHMTAEEQSALMNRQKAQLAEQQSSAAKQGAGGAPAANGPYGGQRNGTAIVQPNGVTTGQAQ